MDYLCIMLRKNLRIFLIFVYLLSISGLSIRSHFCGDELSSIHIFSHNNEVDPCDCVEFGSTDCCSDVLIKAPLAGAQMQCKLLSTPKPLASSFYLLYAHFAAEILFIKDAIGVQHFSICFLYNASPQRSELGVFRI